METPFTSARPVIACCRLFLRSRIPCSVILMGSSSLFTMAWASACPTLNSREKIPIVDASSLTASSALTERNEFCGVFSHGQAQRLNSSLHLIEIKIFEAQGIPEQDMLAIFGERKSTMDQCTIHLEQATEHVSRIGWDVQNHLLEDQQRLLAVDHQVVDPMLMILNDEELMGRVFTHNHKVELMHIAPNSLKICHPLPLQAAVTLTSPVERTVCLQMFSGFSGATVSAQGRKARSPRLRRRRGHSLTCPLPPVHQGAQHVSSRGYNFTIVP